MSVLAYRVRRVSFFGGSALLVLLTLDASASAQNQLAQNQPSQNQPALDQPQPNLPAVTPVPHPSASPPATPPAAPPAQPSPAPATQAQQPPSAPPGEVALPQINVATQKNKPVPRQAARRTAPQPATGASTVPPVSPAEQLTQQNNSFDQARSNIYTTVGTNSDTLSHETIQNLPGGTNQPVEKVILQLPGTTQDSAASGLFHVRNDHANVQFRINGVMLPDGVTGFSTLLNSDLIGSLSLITGALPAEYGMRTTGVLDITTRNDIFNNSGSISYYGGSRGTIQPSFEYGGTFGANCPATAAPGVAKAPSAAANCYSGVQYFFTGTYLQNREGIENTLPTLNAIHDFSQQERGFAYMSTFVDPWTRLTMMMGTATSAFQIPNTPNAPLSSLNTTVPGVPGFNSTALNENQTEDTQFGVLALQRSVNGFDGQLSYFTRYDNLHFIPDPTGDLLLNGVASDISRQSFTNGVQGDASYALNAAHTLRAGFTVSGEKTWVDNTSIVESCTACDGTDTGTTPFPISDNVYQTGWLAGIYAQDEWKITDKLTMNYGARFDQMWQFTDANQLSPRVSFTYTPLENTTFHAGYARYFTPPIQAEASPTNLALFNGTTAQVTNPAGSNPVLPERSHYFDAGVDQKIPLGCFSALKRDCASAEFGVDAYYKQATDLIDNGNFGQALVLEAFNYAKGINEGIEFKAKFDSSYLDAYFNYAIGKEKAMGPVSNQYLFDNTTPLAALGGLTAYQYAATQWITTDHNQDQTASAGIIYKFCGRAAAPGENVWDWCGTKFTADMIYGSGFRQGDDNIDHLPAYAQFNAGISHEFATPDGKPLTLRFDVVNLLDTIYEIRSGTGIGVFAPQWGPRRGYFFGVSKKL
jgi:outer membrane receptor protein involved in Fe transport